ncbi:hypothetical protein YC2023_069139 [Brassica napus]
MRNGTGYLEMMRLMSYKAACACRIYGPEFGYVTKVYGLLENNRNNICMLVENGSSFIRYVRSSTTQEKHVYTSLIIFL